MDMLPYWVTTLTIIVGVTDSNNNWNITILCNVLYYLFHICLKVKNRYTKFIKIIEYETQISKQIIYIIVQLVWTS